MKRATVLLSLTALIMLSVAPVLAQVSVDKPVLPDGYTNWSYTKTYTCKDLKNTAWAKVDKGKNTLEILLVIESRGSIVAYDYIGGDSSKPKFASSFLMSDGKWLKFDGMNRGQYNNFLHGRDDALIASGVTSDCISRMDNWNNDVVINEVLTILTSIKD